MSIRDPYEWARSMLVYQGWMRWRAAAVDPDRLAPVVRSLCDCFKSYYSAWLTLVAERSRAPRSCGTKVAGPVRAGARLPHMLGPTHWDGDRTVVVDVDFDQVSRSRRRLTPLPSRLAEVVTERIDRQLVAPFGYERMSSETWS